MPLPELTTLLPGSFSWIRHCASGGERRQAKRPLGGRSRALEEEEEKEKQEKEEKEEEEEVRKEEQEEEETSWGRERALDWWPARLERAKSC